MEDRVDRRQHAGRAEALGRVAPAERPRADQLAGKRAVERRGHALPRHVADGDDEAVRLGREKVVEVAAELARRREPRGDVDALQPLRQLGRQQRRLDALREPDLLLEPDLVGADRLVEPRVLDRHGRLAREQREDLDVALAERVELRALEIEDADAAILHHQRNHQLRPRVVDDLDVARVGGHVGHEHRLLVQRGVADQTARRACTRGSVDLASP